MFSRGLSSGLNPVPTEKKEKASILPFGGKGKEGSMGICLPVPPVGKRGEKRGEGGVPRHELARKEEGKPRNC